MEKFFRAALSFNGGSRSSTTESDSIKTDLMPYLPIAIEGNVYHKKRGFFRSWHPYTATLQNAVLTLYSGPKDDEHICHIIMISGASVKLTSSSVKDHTALRIETRDGKVSMLSVPCSTSTQWAEELYNASSVTRTDLSNFKVLSKIGKGGYAKVYRVRHDDGKVMALKVLQKPFPGYTRHPGGVKATQLKFLVQERSALQLLKHPYITSLNHAFQDHNHLYMTMDLYGGGSLFEIGKVMPNRRFQEHHIRVWLAQIVSALQYTHSQQFIHRDLKPENILLDKNNHAHLADFGLSCYLPVKKSTVKQAKCGTPEYMAPEIISGAQYSFEVDWWALGIFTYELLVGRSPFAHSSRDVQKQNIATAHPKFPPDVRMSSHAKNLILGLLQKDPCDRLDGVALRSHAFFEGIDWVRVDQGSMPPLDFYNPRVAKLAVTTGAKPSFVDDQETTWSGAIKVLGFEYNREIDLSRQTRAIPSITLLPSTEPSVISGQYHSKVAL